ncbi:hypothetical protein LCGC14_2120080 [marine sediment metagenome]|uniref:TNase-like domain-containing protein n=1 Tax=marine sediment metagenome TaxID=412755 RepID=A0A0F9H0U1_9ZZZZ
MAHDFKLFPELTNNQMAFYYFDSPHKQILEGFIGTVTDVHDGDTIKVKTDFRNFDTRIRFANIAAPELKESGGKNSQTWLQKRILGKEVYVHINPKNRVGKWGRLLGTINEGGLDVGLESILFGHSIPFSEINAGGI